MKRRPIPFTRLSVVFILAMVLSGGVLSYFSINNISNLKELTEKRILEEQQELAARFLQTLQEQLEQLGSGLVNPVDQENTWRKTLIQFAEDHEYIIQPFFIRNGSRFIVPNFTGISDETSRGNISPRFEELFLLGEGAEFAGSDPTGASKYYQSCLNLSNGASDSVIALNALGRVSIKSGRMDDAIAYYGLILRNYFYLTDRNGFPYAYYALLNLVNHTDTAHLDQIKALIWFSLEKMEDGQIPLNFQSKELLDLLAGWSLESMTTDSILFIQIDHSIIRLDAKVQFINQFGDELKELIQEKNNRNHQENQHDFSVQNVTSANDSLFYIFVQTPPYTSGYLMDRNVLFASIANADLQKDMEFGYTLEFPVEINSSTTLNNPIYSVQLNPFFPEQTLLISLINEDLITDLVKRRGWIYGVATFLLLIAMMLGIILTLRDITREKRLATLRSDFISNVTHELKTPLTSIRMYAESLIMKRIKTEAGRKKYLSVVINESERLKRMINNILEFSKMEKARQEVHPVDTSLSDIFLASIQDMNYWLEEKKLQMVNEITPQIHAGIDPEKFRQVFTNLLSNAIKYSTGPGKIFVRLYKNEGHIISEVEDQGIGIPQDQFIKIFEEFYRVEQEGSAEVTGTGLGLTVVKEIVEAHGGKIKVESKIGQGSNFSVILYQ